MVWSRLTALVASCTLLVLADAEREAWARTYVRPQPDPWYTISVELDPSSLPPGVTIRDHQITLGFYQGIQRLRSLHNDGPTPLHLVRTLASPPDWLGHVPPNEVAVRKAMLGKGHSIDFETDVWTPAHGEARTFLSEILADPMDKAIGLKGPGRPASPVPPPPQTVRFRAFHGARELIFTATLTYEVNPAYNPRRTNEYYDLNWFRIRAVHVDPAQLPPGIRILESEGHPHPLLKLFIVNDGPTPLWVTARAPEPVAWATQFPAGTVPYWTLAQGKAWWFRKPSKLYGQAGDVGGLVEETRGLGWTVDTQYVIRESGVVSRQVHADDRPADVAVPVPQEFALRAFHGEAPVSLRGQLVYALNPQYRPDAGRLPPSIASCTGFTCPGAERQALFLPALMAGLAALNLVFFRSLRRPGERRLSVGRGILLSAAEAIGLQLAFIGVSTWVFWNSVRWLGLQGHALVVLALTPLLVALSLPLLLRYRCSPRTAALFVLVGVLLLRAVMWLTGHG